MDGNCKHTMSRQGSKPCSQHRRFHYLSGPVNCAHPISGAEERRGNPQG